MKSNLKSRDPLRLFAVVQHSKNEDFVDALGRPLKQFKRRCPSSNYLQKELPGASNNYTLYKPGVGYSLFAPFEGGPAHSVISLRKPIKGFLVEKYFSKEKGIEKYRESLFDHGARYPFSRVFSPLDK